MVAVAPYLCHAGGGESNAAVGGGLKRGVRGATAVKQQQHLQPRVPEQERFLIRKGGVGVRGGGGTGRARAAWVGKSRPAAAHR